MTKGGWGMDGNPAVETCGLLAGWLSPSRLWNRPLLDRVLDACGLDLDIARAPDLVVAAGQNLILTDQSDDSALVPHIIGVDDVDTAKALVGVEDHLVRPDAPPLAMPLPAQPWTLGDDFDPAELTQAQRDDIKNAAYNYMFGNSALVASYRGAISRLYSPFRIPVYVARRVSLETEGSLLLNGSAALVVCREMEIAEGGRLTCVTPFNLVAERMSKLEPPSSNHPGEHACPVPMSP